MPWALMGQRGIKKRQGMQQQRKKSLEAVQAQVQRTRQAVMAASQQQRNGCTVLEYDPASDSHHSPTESFDCGNEARSKAVPVGGQEMPHFSAPANGGQGEAEGAKAGPHRLAVGRWILTQKMLHQERRLSAGQHRYLSLLGQHQPGIPSRLYGIMHVDWLGKSAQTIP